MITPLDVQKKTFKKRLFGYSEKDVVHFMQEVANTLEKHINDNADLKERVVRVMDEVNKYKAIETTLSETLVVAKKASEDLVDSAKLQAQNIVQEAKLQAKSTEEQLRRDIDRLHHEQMLVEKELTAFKMRLEGMLRAQLKALNHYEEDIIQRHSEESA
jgi:cell division initiation protein